MRRLTRAKTNLFERRFDLFFAFFRRVPTKVAAHAPLERREGLNDAPTRALLGEGLCDEVLVESEELLRGCATVLLKLEEIQQADYGCDEFIMRQLRKG